MSTLLIREILDMLKEDKISSRALKKMDPFLADMSTKTFQRARKLATEGTDWTLEGSSLIRVRAGPGFADSSLT